MEAEEKTQLIAQFKQQLADQLAEKDNLISTLLSRISSLEQQISNQSAVLEKLNDNFTSLNQQRSTTNPPDNIKRKKTNLFNRPGSSNISANRPSTSTGEATIGPQHVITDPNLNNVIVDEKMDDSINNHPNPTFASIASKQSRPMPIQLGVTDRSTLEGLLLSLKTKFHTDCFDIVQLNSNATPKIYAATAEIKNQLIDFLQSNNFEFNTFAEKGEKQQSFIVRGLNFGDDKSNISRIKEALIDVGINSEIDCIRFITSHMKRSIDQNPNQSILYRFTMSHQESTAGLSSIKLINGFRVVIEKMKKSAVIQCRRCQRFQHTANQCSFNYRCVQCVTIHNPGQCPRAVNKKLPLQCCNCIAAGFKKSDHTSNNLMECEFFKTKHSILFNKLNESSHINHPSANSTSNISGSSNSLAPPAPTSPNRPHKEKAQTTQTLQVPALNPFITVSRNKRKTSTYVNPSKSHANDRQPNQNNDKLNAFTNALIQLINGFCNAN